MKLVHEMSECTIRTIKRLICKLIVLTLTIVNCGSMLSMAQNVGALVNDAPHAHASLKGQIFVSVLRRSPTRANGQQPLIKEIIAIDPNSGRWKSAVSDGDKVRASADGTKLAFDRRGETWVCNLASPTKARRVSSMAWGVPCWSPNGSKIIVGKRIPSGVQNWVVDVDGGQTKKLDLANSEDIEDWSSDGKWFVSSSSRHGGLRLYLIAAEGSREYATGDPEGINVYPRISADSSHVVFTHQYKGNTSIRIAESKKTESRAVWPSVGQAVPEAACWAPDDKLLAVLVETRPSEEKGGTSRKSCQLFLCSPDGANRREIKLEGLDPIYMGHPDWK